MITITIIIIIIKIIILIIIIIIIKALTKTSFTSETVNFLKESIACYFKQHTVKSTVLIMW